MKIEDFLWAETDDSCALCGCRERRALTIHHIDGKRKNNSYDNRIILCHNCHQRHHDGKRTDITLEQIRDRKRRLMMKTLTQYGLNALKVADRSGGIIGAPFLLNHLVELGYLEKQNDCDICDIGNGQEVVETSQYSITKEGKALLSGWFE